MDIVLGRRVVTILGAMVLGLSLPGQAPAPALIARKPGIAASVLHSFPMTVTMSTVGSTPMRHSTFLSINSAGHAELTMMLLPRPKVVQFVVPAEKMDQLRQIVEDGKFFELNEEYGQNVPDSSVQTISITIGEYTRTVKLRYLMNWIRESPEKLAEPSRAVRITRLLSDLYDEPEALNLGKYDQKILDAVK